MVTQTVTQANGGHPSSSPTAHSFSRQAARIDGNGAVFGEAIVVGGSIAGLTAARVLSDYFKKVTIVDRDHAPDPVEFRRGVPQTRHAHRLLPAGQRILEQQFPGLIDELLAQGAVGIDAGEDMAFDYEDGWQPAPWRRKKLSLSCSRPLLESTIYRRLATLPNVHVVPGYAVRELLVDDENERVTGVRLYRRGDSAWTDLNADLVVDASGRHSKAPQWLESLGYTAPEEWSVDAFGGYATRIYERPHDFEGEWKTLSVSPTPPHDTRGGLIVPLEGDRWQVTLVGVAGDYPPRDEEGFMAFAKSLPTPRIYDAIKQSKPLSRPAGFRGTASRVRLYDNLPSYLEGFLVLGDAAFILNPVYAQGMTAAAKASRALDQVLARQPEGDLMGLSCAFQKQLKRSLNGLWRAVTSQDWQWSATTISDGDERIYLN